jgi:hypothetical protein
LLSQIEQVVSEPNALFLALTFIDEKPDFGFTIVDNMKCVDDVGEA